MPRARRRTQDPPTNVEDTSVTTTQTTNENEGENNMSDQTNTTDAPADGTVTLDFDALANQDELSEDDVLAILAGGREKGIYDDALIDFLRAGKMGVPYRFTGKKAASVKTGFESAKTRLKDGKIEKATDEEKALAEDVEVRVRDEKVFLLRQDLAKAAKAARA